MQLKDVTIGMLVQDKDGSRFGHVTGLSANPIGEVILKVSWVSAYCLDRENKGANAGPNRYGGEVHPGNVEPISTAAARVRVFADQLR